LVSNQIKRKSPKIDAIVKNVKEMAQMVQTSEASSSFQIFPHSAFSRYSIISNKKNG
jgi:uncharacterized protein YoxC